MSSHDYPKGEFGVGDDNDPVPVGVYRAQTPRWHSWVSLLVITTIVPVLAWDMVTLFLSDLGGFGPSNAVSSFQPTQGGQIGGNRSVNNKGDKGGKGGAVSAEPSASASTSDSVDFDAGVSVADGANTDGLAKGTSEELTSGGFTAVKTIPGIYKNAGPAQSTVYLSSPQARLAAEEVGKRFGISNVVEGTAGSTQGASTAVILHDDYKLQ